MADPKAKLADNVPGKFFVDDQCIACDACIMEAPNFFEMNDDEGYAFVKKQPISPEEIDECDSALDTCPVGAIGTDA
jgi:ferredoxin